MTELPRNASPSQGWLYRRAVLPFLVLLRTGATPERLAWSIASGFVIGLNPLFGSTTLLCLVVAAVFRLNLAASQLANYLAYPLQMLLVLPFIRAGSRLFRTAPLPLSPAILFEEARTRPFALIRKLWLWEIHAVIVWALAAAVFAPTIALVLMPILRRILERGGHHSHVRFRSL